MAVKIHAEVSCYDEWPRTFFLICVFMIQEQQLF